MKLARRKLILSLVLTTSILGCRAEGPEVDENPLYVDPATVDLSANEALRERLTSSPHGYFRFINIPFSREVCARLGGSVEGTPLFNLHGDAHLEQYAVTDLGRGLTDFDDSSVGPAVVDLLRFGVSLELACREQGCAQEIESLFDEFLRGYTTALEDPLSEASEPTAASRLRSGFSHDREAYFGWIESVMEPMDAGDRERLIGSLAPYVAAMREQEPELAEGYFEVEAVGRLRAGIGSALDRKYLVRVRGESDEPLDDRVLEVKQVRELSAIDCIAVSLGTDPFRILLGQARIAYQPYGLLGYLRMDGISFWIHAWVENYKEVEIGETLQSTEELAEVAFDVGVQLGRGHPNQIGAPLDLQLRREQLRLVDRDRERIRAERRDLTRLVIEAWERFRREI